MTFLKFEWGLFFLTPIFIIIVICQFFFKILLPHDALVQDQQVVLNQIEVLVKFLWCFNFRQLTAYLKNYLNLVLVIEIKFYIGWLSLLSFNYFPNLFFFSFENYYLVTIFPISSAMYADERFFSTNVEYYFKKMIKYNVALKLKNEIKKKVEEVK